MICSNIKLTWPGESIVSEIMFFMSNPNGIAGTLGPLPVLSLGRRDDIPHHDRKTPMTTASHVSVSNLKTLRDEASRLPCLSALERCDADRVRRRPAACARSCWSASSPATRKTLPATVRGTGRTDARPRAARKPASTATKAYVTNAVKHFKFVPRGKIRLHQKPNTSGDQGVPAMVRTRTGLDQTRSGGGDGRDCCAMRVRQNHADQQKPRTPDRS